MSELHTALDRGPGTADAAIPASSGVCAQAGTLASAVVPAGAEESISLLKRLLSFPTMLGAMLVGAVFITARSFQVDPDLWWHIKTGQNILATHHWPTTDPYSFTVSGTPWVAYEWLGEVLQWRVSPAYGDSTPCS